MWVQLYLQTSQRWSQLISASQVNSLATHWQAPLLILRYNIKLSHSLQSTCVCVKHWWKGPFPDPHPAVHYLLAEWWKVWLTCTQTTRWQTPSWKPLTPFWMQVMKCYRKANKRVDPVPGTWHISFVAVPCKSRRLFRRVFRSHRCLWSAVLLNFR